MLIWIGSQLSTQFQKLTTKCCRFLAIPVCTMKKKQKLPSRLQENLNTIKTMTKSFSNPVKSSVSKQTQETSAMKIKYKHPMKSLSVFLKKDVIFKGEPIGTFSWVTTSFKIFVYARAVAQRQHPFWGQGRIIHAVAEWEERVYQTKNKKSRMLLPNLGIYEKSTYGRILLHF